MFIYRWEENDHVSSTVFFPIGCRSRKSLFICIKLKDSELCRVAGHAPSSRQRSLSLAVARVAGNRQLSIEINGIVSLCRWVSLVVWTGLKTLTLCCLRFLKQFDIATVAQPIEWVWGGAICLQTNRKRGSVCGNLLKTVTSFAHLFGADDDLRIS